MNALILIILAAACFTGAVVMLVRSLGGEWRRLGGSPDDEAAAEDKKILREIERWRDGE